MIVSFINLIGLGCCLIVESLGVNVFLPILFFLSPDKPTPSPSLYAVGDLRGWALPLH